MVEWYAPKYRGNDLFWLARESQLKKVESQTTNSVPSNYKNELNSFLSVIKGDEILGSSVHVTSTA
jgi:hypothetical protein